MPPKIRFTREELATAAFDLVREEGTDALTARALAKHARRSQRTWESAYLR